MRDHRGRTIQYQDSRRIKHLPKKRIEDCFEVETISYFITYSNHKGKEFECSFVSANYERSFKQENKELFIFN
jgi:hypothetical protein